MQQRTGPATKSGLEWESQREYLEQQLKIGVSLEALSYEYDVSKQRMQQVVAKLGLKTALGSKRNATLVK